MDLGNFFYNENRGNMVEEKHTVRNVDVRYPRHIGCF